jgi:hypothetical protein
MPDSLPVDCAYRVLDVARAALTDHGFTIPAQSDLSHGPPPVDLGATEQLMVYVGVDARPFSKRRTTAPGQQQVVGILSIMTITVQLWRCTPPASELGQPDLDGETLNARDLLNQGWAIWSAIVTARDRGTLLGASLGGMALTRTDIGVGQLQSLGPQGYAAGYAVDIEVNVPLTYAADRPGS